MPDLVAELDTTDQPEPTAEADPFAELVLSEVEPVAPALMFGFAAALAVGIAMFAPITGVQLAATVLAIVAATVAGRALRHREGEQQ